jgi:hypothetical protein
MNLDIIMVVGLLVGGGIAVAVICATPILVGFGTGGVVAGSAAAGAQAVIGNVAAGSWFASMTSLGMTGTFVKGVTSGVALVATGILI